MTNPSRFQVWNDIAYVSVSLEKYFTFWPGGSIGRYAACVFFSAFYTLSILLSTCWFLFISLGNVFIPRDTVFFLLAFILHLRCESVGGRYDGEGGPIFIYSCVGTTPWALESESAPRVRPSGAKAMVF